MATTNVTGIVPGAESEIHDEPHVEGSRVTVRLLQQRVEERGPAPAEVAERHDLDVVDVYGALAYYHNNPKAMGRVEQRRAELSEVAAEKSTLTPPEG